MKLTKNFELEEFVSPELFKKFSVKSQWFLDPCIVHFAQTFREYIGRAVIINNWHTGGVAKYSGQRPFNCKIGASLSQHKFGRAVDIKVEGFSGAELRKIIVSNYDKLFSDYITTIEDGTDTWLHADCRWTDSQELFIVPFQ